MRRGPGWLPRSASLPALGALDQGRLSDLASAALSDAARRRATASPDSATCSRRLRLNGVPVGPVRDRSACATSSLVQPLPRPVRGSEVAARRAAGEDAGAAPDLRRACSPPGARTTRPTGRTQMNPRTARSPAATAPDARPCASAGDRTLRAASFPLFHRRTCMEATCWPSLAPRLLLLAASGLVAVAARPTGAEHVTAGSAGSCRARPDSASRRASRTWTRTCPINRSKDFWTWRIDELAAGGDPRPATGSARCRWRCSA
jgi:hypothetical protein